MHILHRKTYLLSFNMCCASAFFPSSFVFFFWIGEIFVSYDLKIHRRDSFPTFFAFFVLFFIQVSIDFTYTNFDRVYPSPVCVYANCFFPNAHTLKWLIYSTHPFNRTNVLVVYGIFTCNEKERKNKMKWNRSKKTY